MERLNYRHLLYFWTVIRAGGVLEASRQLKVSQPTISEQIHALEQELGRKLFRRTGRKLQPTEVGRLVLRYADKIFRLGADLQKAVQKSSAGGRAKPKRIKRRNGSVLRRRTRS